MGLSEKNAKTLLLEISRDIEEYADATVQNIFDKKDLENISYPPNGGLKPEEKEALLNLHGDDHLKNALRKLIADNTAGVIFSLLNLIDGTTSPQNEAADWTGVRLVDMEENEDEDQDMYEEMLHDGLFETYWKWKEQRPGKPWQPDNTDSER